MGISLMVAVVGRLIAREDGQDLIEYGLLVALIAIVAILGITYLGTTIDAVLWEPIAQNF